MECGGGRRSRSEEKVGEEETEVAIRKQHGWAAP